jgi:transposase
LRPRLSATQVGRLERELKRGAFAHGYAGDFWTLDRIGQLIWQLFAVRYHPSGVWHVLRRMGWSCQRPQRRPFGRDDEAVARWRRVVWPEIKKVA